MSNEPESWDGDRTMRVRDGPSPAPDEREPAKPAPPRLVSGVPELPTAWDQDPTVVAGAPVSHPPAAPARPPETDPQLKALLTGVVLRTSSSTRAQPLPEPVEVRKTRSVDEQMFALLGGHSFESREPKQLRTRLLSREVGPGPKLWRYGVALLFVALGGFVVFVVGYGLRVRSQRSIDELHAQLEGVSNGGALQDAESLVRKIDTLENKTPAQLRLVARTDALLYRFRDASPARLEDVKAKVEKLNANDNADVTIISALIASTADRIAMLPKLKKLADETEDSEASFLAASALSRAGAAEAAVKYFEKSLDLEPSHLEHLAAYTRHQIDNGALNEAENLLAVMREVSPTSTWTQLGAALLNRAQDTDRHTVESSEDPIEIPVAEAELLLLQAIERHDADDALAIDDVQAAVKRINNGQPFLVDFVDRLLDASWPEAARIVVRNGGLTGTTPGAAAAVGRLVLAEGDAARAATELGDVFAGGFVEPVSGHAYLEALQATRAPAALRTRTSEELRAAWPNEAAELTKPKRANKKRKRRAKKRRRRRR